MEHYEIINSHRWKQQTIISINDKDHRVESNDKGKKFLFNFVMFSMKFEIYEFLKATQDFSSFLNLKLFSCDLILRFRHFY